MGRVIPALLLCVAVLAAPSAYAADNPCERAEDALAGDRLVEAEAAYTLCLDVTDDDQWTLRSLLMLGVIHKLQGEPMQALSYMRRFLSAAATGDHGDDARWQQARENASEDAAALEAQLRASHATVALTSDPSGARLHVDGMPSEMFGAAQTPLQIFVPAGEHRFELRLDGHEPWVHSLVLSAGQMMTRSVRMKPVAPEHEGGVVTVAPPTRRWRTTGYVTAGAGAAAIVAGGVLTSMARSEMSDVRALAGKPRLSPDEGRAFDDGVARAQRLEKVYWSLYGVGALAVAGGLYLALSDEEPPPVTVTATPAGATFSYVRRF